MVPSLPRHSFHSSFEISAIEECNLNSKVRLVALAEKDVGRFPSDVSVEVLEKGECFRIHRASPLAWILLLLGKTEAGLSEKVLTKKKGCPPMAQKQTTRRQMLTDKILISFFEFGSKMYHVCLERSLQISNSI